MHKMSSLLLVALGIEWVLGKDHILDKQSLVWVSPEAKLWFLTFCLFCDADIYFDVVLFDWKRNKWVIIKKNVKDWYRKKEPSPNSDLKTRYEPQKNSSVAKLAILGDEQQPSDRHDYVRLFGPVSICKTLKNVYCLT